MVKELNDIKITNGGSGLLLKWGAVGILFAAIFGAGVWVKGIEAAAIKSQEEIVSVKDEIHRVEMNGTRVSQQNTADIRLLQKDIDSIIKSMAKNDSDHEKIMKLLQEMHDEFRSIK